MAVLDLFVDKLTQFYQRISGRNNNGLAGIFVLYSLVAAEMVYAKDWRVVTENAPPLQYMTEQGVAGYSTTIVKQLLQELDLSVDIEVVPWARGYDLAMQRKNTLIYSMIRTPQREPQFHWIGRLGHFQLSFAGLKHRKGLVIASLPEAKKWVVGAMRHDYTHKYLLQNGFSDADLVIRSELRELVDLLYKEKIDTFIVDIALLSPMIEALGFDKNLVTPLLDIAELKGEVYLAANVNSDPEMVAKMQATFISLFGEQTLKQRFLIPE